MLLAGLQMDDDMHHSSSANLDTQVPTNSASSSSSSSAVRQSSAAAQASQKQPRQAQPLKMVETDASKHRLTYAQATMAVATTLIEQPQRLPTQRVVKPTPFLGEFFGNDALIVRGSKRKAEPRATKVTKKTVISGASVVNSGAPTGMVPLNHVDHYVAEQSGAATGAPVAVTNIDPLVPTSTQLPPSLFLDSGDEDDDGSYNQNEMVHVPSEGNKTPSPLPMPTMDPSSDDNISDSTDAAGADVCNNNDDASGAR